MLSDEFRKNGYVLERGVLSSDCRLAAQSAMKSSESSGVLAQSFPFEDDELSMAVISESAISAMRRIGIEGIPTLIGSTASTKIGGEGTYGQTLHQESLEHRLTVPRSQADVENVIVLCYLSDICSEADGPTAVVPRHASGDMDVSNTYRVQPNHNLYDVESPVLAEAGDALIFADTTFHRATEVALGHRRVSMLSAYHFRDGSTSQAWCEGSMHVDQWKRIRRLYGRMSWRQAEAMGFPPEEDSYWNQETLAKTTARYPGIRLG